MLRLNALPIVIALVVTTASTVAASGYPATGTTPSISSADLVLKKRVAANRGTACVGYGTACSYVPEDRPEVTVNGFCAQNGICADNGAPCSTDDNCFSKPIHSIFGCYCPLKGSTVPFHRADYCGTDDVCGGLGATCTSQSTDMGDTESFTCYTPTYVCSLNEWGGTCLLTPSMAAGRRHRQRARDLSHSRILDSFRRYGAPLDSSAQNAENDPAHPSTPNLRARHSSADLAHTQTLHERLVIAGDLVWLPGDEPLDL